MIATAEPEIASFQTSNTKFAAVLRALGAKPHPLCIATNIYDKAHPLKRGVAGQYTWVFEDKIPGIGKCSHLALAWQKREADIDFDKLMLDLPEEARKAIMAKFPEAIVCYMMGAMQWRESLLDTLFKQRRFTRTRRGKSFLVLPVEETAEDEKFRRKHLKSE